MSQAIHIKKPLISIPQPLAAEIVSAIFAASDKMKEVTALNQYITHNHDKNKFWDMLNTNIYQTLNSPDCMSSIKKRGFWELLLAYHKLTGIIFTFMREQRFQSVQAEIKKHGKMTYTNMLIQHLNKDLLASTSQISMFPIHSHDETELAERIKALIGDFQNASDAIGYYTMILFDCDSSYELRSVRAVIVDTNLDIFEEVRWSQHIPVKETVVVEKVSDTTLPSNNPSRGLTLKPKALDRKMQKDELASKDDGDFGSE